MSQALCVGIASKDGLYEVVALEHGKESVVLRFPGTTKGIEAICGFLSHCGDHVRLAVAGVASLSLALAVGDSPGRQTFIVSSNTSIAGQAAALAHFADHTL
jgi:hypothetical protein